MRRNEGYDGRIVNNMEVPVRRRRGRPKLMWLHCVTEALRENEVVQTRHEKRRRGCGRKSNGHETAGEKGERKTKIEVVALRRDYREMRLRTGTEGED